MKKLLVLENDHLQDIPETIKNIIEESNWAKQFNIEIWAWFGEAYYPENREASIKRLSACENYICQHVFINWCQLEIFIEILSKFKKAGKKINMWIVHPSVKDTFEKWLSEYRAYTTPETPEYDNSIKLTEKFKREMNKSFLSLLDYHNIYGVGSSHFIHEEKPIRAKHLKKV